MSASVYNPPPTLLSYHKQFSLLYLPNQDEIAALSPKLKPFAFVLYNGAIGAQQADRQKYSTQTEAWITSLVASSSQAAGFACQFYDTYLQQLWEQNAIPNVRLGTGRRQFFLKKLYHLPSGGQIQSRVINLALATNNIQIVAWGLR